MRRCRAQLLRDRGVSAILGPEAEADLVGSAQGTPAGQATQDDAGFAAARLHHAGARRPAAASNAMRRCRCPTARAASQGRPMRRAGASIDAGIARSSRSTMVSSASCRSTSSWRTSISRWRAGAEHITFGDPDFFNGPTHARRIVESAARAASVAHLRRDYQGRAPARASRACCRCWRRRAVPFITSAVEALDDTVLLELEKGHTRADFITAVAVCREAGVCRWRRPSSRLHRGRRSTATAIC